MGNHFCLELIFYKPMGAKNYLHEIFNKFGLMKAGVVAWVHNRWGINRRMRRIKLPLKE
jgi:hypothetical protein